MTRPRPSTLPAIPRPSIDELIAAKKSMLDASISLPINYGGIENGLDLREELTRNEPDSREARIYIVWDLPFDALHEFEDVMDKMRALGAAMVTKAELLRS